MNLFNLVATLTLNKQAYEQGLNSAGKEASSFSSKAGVAFKAVGTAVTAVITVVATLAAGITKAITSFADFTNEIDDNAKALQISTTEYQRLDWLFKQIGADSSTMQMAMRQLADMTSKLADGEGDAILKLQQLGIAYDDFMEMSAYEQFEAIVEAFQDMEQGIQKTRLAQEIFGNRTYQKLMPVLNESVGYLDDFNEELDRMGILLSEEDVAAGEKFSDTLLYLKGIARATAYNFISDFIPALQKISNGFIALASGSDNAWSTIKEGINELVDEIVNKIGDITQYIPEIIQFVSELSLAFSNAMLEYITSSNGTEILGKIGAVLGKLIVNKFLESFFAPINAAIKLINKIFGTNYETLNYTFEDIFGDTGGGGGGGSRTRANGGMFDEKYTTYYVGEYGNAEIVAQGKYGTGVANVEQIEEAQYNALARIAPVLVNGIVSGINLNTDNSNHTTIVKIGEKEFKSYIVQASNDNLNQKGRKTLNNVTGY